MATSLKRTRRVKAAGSPEPVMNPACGHSGCGLTCNVRYCGPTSPMRDHHIIHAARGAAHVWTAAIVAGLAVVLTGAIAYSAVEAQSIQNNPTTLIMLALRRIEMRLDRMEPKLNILVGGQNSLGNMHASGTEMQAQKLQCYQRCSANMASETEKIIACMKESCPQFVSPSSGSDAMRDGDASKRPEIKKVPMPRTPEDKPTLPPKTSEQGSAGTEPSSLEHENTIPR